MSDVTAPNHVRDAAEFGRMDEFLRGAFPRVFQQLKVEKVRRQRRLRGRSGPLAGAKCGVDVQTE